MNQFKKIRWRDALPWCARAIVWLWPDDSKEWGRAFAAELPQIQGFPASARWLIGGTMLLTREQFRSFWRSLRRPVGMGASVARGDALRFPRTPRGLTLLLLCGAIAFLLRGEMRTGLGMVAKSVTDAQWDTARWSSVHALQRKAAETGDPKLLALLSLLAGTETERVRLAEQAVAKDVSLTRLLYEFRLRGEGTDASVIERAKQVQKWDPENAAPRLLAAEPVFERIVNAVNVSSMSGLPHPGKMNELEEAAATDSEWMAAMDRAFSATSYDTYAKRRIELLREVSKKYGINDPDITAHVVAGQMMPNFFNLGTYARVLLYRNAEGRSDAAAMADAWKVLHFTEQIQLQGHSQLEDLITANITIEACKQLEPLLQKAGRGEEAGLVAFESDRWKIELERLKSRNMTVGDSTGSLVWAAVTMHLAVTAIALFGVLSLVGLALLAWPKNKADGWLSVFCSAAVDWAPAMLATACLALFAAYHPYSCTYQTYFQDKAPSINAESMETLVAAAGVPSFLTDGMQTGFRDPIVAYTGWMAVTVVLTIATVLLMIHAWKRRLV